MLFRYRLYLKMIYVKVNLNKIKILIAYISLIKVVIYLYNIFKYALLNIDASCATDQDGCRDNPCTYSTCTDATPAQQASSGIAFTCGPCDDGFTKVDPTNVNSNCIGEWSILYIYFLETLGVGEG